VAIVTIGKHTILRDLIQAVWRMRGLDRSQKVEFVVDEESKEAILSVLKKITGATPSEELTLEQLLVYATYNQSVMQGDNNYRSLHHKMDMILQQEVFGAVLDPSVDKTALNKLLVDTRDLFITTHSLEPWDLFGEIQELEVSEKVVQSDFERQRKSASFKAFNANPIIKAREKGKREARIPTVEESLKQLEAESVDILPSKLLTTAASGTKDGREVEKETAKETEKQVLIDKEVGSQLQSRLPLNNISLEEIGVFDSRSYLFSPTKEKFISGTGFSLLHTERAFQDSSLENYRDVFDPELLSSINLQRKIDVSGYKYEPFDIYQKSVSSVLIVKIKGWISDSFRVVMLDHQDTAIVRKALENYVNKEIETMLYDFRVGIIEGGENPLPDDLLEKNQKVLKLVTQAKFFNGELTYSEKELEYLKKWIEEKGVNKMFTLFREHILKWKAESALAFESSPIGKLFSELGHS